MPKKWRKSAWHRPEHEQARTILRNIQEEGEIESYQTRNTALAILARSGYIEWCALKTIGYNLLSSNGRKRLTELDRKFCAGEIPTPLTVEAFLVGSPISSNAARHMTDRQWLDAMNEYVDDYPPNSFRDPSIGGALSVG